MDGPDGNFSTAKRTVSTTPLQALTWMNGKFIQDQADALASRLRSETGDDPEALVRRAYQIVFCRTPGPEELQGCVTYLTGGQQGASRLTPQRLASLCLVLLNTNEFAYIN
jgi:hypothetical protein